MQTKNIIIILILLVVVLFGFSLFTKPYTQTPVDTVPIGWKEYSSPILGFSILYPEIFTVNEDYAYTLVPGKEIYGVSFNVPESLTKGTNLSSDTHLSIEYNENDALQKTTCSSADFLDNIQATSTLAENGITYDVAQSSGAGAGNFYEETVFSRSDCIAIRYFIHSTNIGNYEPGTVQEFNKAELLGTFDDIRQSYRNK